MTEGAWNHSPNPRTPPTGKGRFSFSKRTQEEKEAYAERMQRERYKNRTTSGSLLIDRIEVKKFMGNEVYKREDGTEDKKPVFEVKTKYKFRVHDCGQYPHGGKSSPIEIWVTKEGNHAHYKGLNVCGSVWTCPVCAPKISSYRSKELTEALSKVKLSVKYAVFTLQHNRGSDLNTLLDDLTEGFRLMLSGATGKRFYEKWGIVGTITALEYTFGLENGHHPHKNILFFSSRPQSDLDSEEFKADFNNLAARYCRSITSKGYQVVDGVTVKTTETPKDGDTDQVVKYITKWATEDEVTQGQSKEAHPGHFTPFQLLATIGDPATSDDARSAYIKAFREYADCFKGRRQLVFSRGFRELLGLNAKESTDEEVAEAGEEPSTLFVSLSWGQYYQVLKREKLGDLGHILNLAAKKNLGAFWDYMIQIGAPPSDTQVLAMLAINDGAEGKSIAPEKEDL